MLVLALSLGFLGSLHCMGMCGPLAFNISVRKAHGIPLQSILHALSYNVGRIITYSLMGLIFGLVGSMLVLTSLQKWSSIILGVFFILSFIIAKTPEHLFLRTSVGRSVNTYVYKALDKILKSSTTVPSLLVGMVNGLLPCGLVYVAISGALMATSYTGGMLFMLCFGVGTIPLMAAIMILPSLGKKRLLKGFNRVLPYINLGFGIFLIYRAIAVDMPLELNFLEAVNNPIMCH